MHEEIEVETEETSPKPTSSKPEPIFVSEGDRQKAEIANLRRLISAQQITILQLQLNDAVRRNTELTQAANQLQADLSKKYGVDLVQMYDIRSEDGMLIPRNMTVSNLQRMIGG